MSDFNIKRLDLNLLRTLQVLIEEGNVSRAAQRLALSQSAVSHSLARLREQLNDQLFVRSARGIEPTNRTMEIAGPLRQILGEIDQLAGPAEFDPATENRTLHITATDYGAAIVIPPVLARIAEEAPHVNVELHDWSEQTSTHLKTGFIELALGVPAQFPYYETDTLFKESFVSVVRKNHPATKRKYDLDAYLSYGHVQVDIVHSYMRQVDKQLAQLGRERDIKLILSKFLAVPSIIGQTDLVGTLPTRVAEMTQGPGGLVILPLPVKISRFPYVQVWHESRKNDPLHRWLRELIRTQSQLGG